MMINLQVLKLVVAQIVLDFLKLLHGELMHNNLIEILVKLFFCILLEGDLSNLILTSANDSLRSIGIIMTFNFVSST